MEKKTYWAGMSKTEMQCRIHIHGAADGFFIKTCNMDLSMDLSDFHNRAAWRYYDILHGYESDKARDWIRNNLGMTVYSGNRTKFETNF